MPRHIVFSLNNPVQNVRLSIERVAAEADKSPFASGHFHHVPTSPGSAGPLFNEPVEFPGGSGLHILGTQTIEPDEDAPLLNPFQ